MQYKSYGPLHFFFKKEMIFFAPIFGEILPWYSKYSWLCSRALYRKAESYMSLFAQ